jgi:CheY-like chemotaxis protein
MIPPAEANGRKRFHILVVEDYEDAAQSLAMLLKLHGYQVDIARNGTQAIAAALHQRPDAILLDIGLPGGGGYRVASTLRQEASCKDTLIIAISGYGQAEDRRRSREAGIDHHLLKPVDSNVLLGLLPPSEAAGCSPEHPDSPPGAVSVS